MMLAFLEMGSVEYMVLLVIFLILVAYMYRLGKNPPEQTRAEALKTKYATITEELLANAPEEELVDGVVANLMAKTDKKNPDPYYMVMAASRGRRAVYSVWLVVKELTHGDLEKFRQSPSARYAEPAIEGLELFGAEACAMLLTKAMEAEEPDEIYNTAFKDGVGQENPLALAAAYIRDNMADFVDDDVAEMAEEEELVEETEEATEEE